jgi:predicted HAD superfamily Cof-like phosphohydrolase
VTDCRAHISIEGADFSCDWPADANGEHAGWAHANKEAQALWSEDREMPLSQQGTRHESTNLLDGTAEFMRHAKQPEDQWKTWLSDPQMADLRTLRTDLLCEEHLEYLDAEYDGDLVEIVDGLLDVIVIAWGTLITYIGEDRAKAAAAEVVRSNLDKVIGEGLPIFRADGKVLKPEGWTAPDIAGAIA